MNNISTYQYRGNLTETLKPGADLNTRLEAAGHDVWWGVYKLDETRLRLASTIRKLNKARDRAYDSDKKLKEAAAAKAEAEKKWSNRIEHIQYVTIDYWNDYLVVNDNLVKLKEELSDILAYDPAKSDSSDSLRGAEARIDELRDWFETRELRGMELQEDLKELFNQMISHRKEDADFHKKDEFRVLEWEIRKVKREKAKVEERFRALREKYDKHIHSLKGLVVQESRKRMALEKREKELVQTLESQVHSK